MGVREATAADLRGQPAAERRQALVLFAELRNFTRMSEMLEPQRVLELASEFFALAARAAESSGGESAGLHNDTLVAGFRRGSPAQICQQGVRAAQQIQREFGLLADSWEKQFGLRTAVAMGLHLGETVFGASGSAGRQQFVAFGDTVSVANRLLHRARAGEFVLSDSVLGALGAANLHLEAEALPPLELARRPAIRIYGVLLDTRLDFT